RDRAAAGGGLAKGRDRAVVGLEIALRIACRARRLAQHVVGMAVAEPFLRLGALEGLLDGAAHDELAAQDAHRLKHGLADEGLAAPRHETAEDRTQLALAMIGEPDDAPREHEGPGRGIHEDRFALAEVT